MEAERQHRREQARHLTAVGTDTQSTTRSRGRQPKRGEEIFAGTDYPKTWAGFVGQDEAKEQLQVHIASRRAENKPLDHILLASGLHGVGKTTLAHLIAYKAKAGLHEVSGAIDVEKFKQLVKTMEDGDVLLWDEFHTAVAGGKGKVEWILPFMTEGRLYSDQGAIECPKISIVAATTDGGRLPETVLSRFMVKPKLVPYSEDEALEITRNLAERMNVRLDDVEVPAIAQASSGNPRDMRSILTAARDLQLAFADDPLDLDKAIRWAGFSKDGLTQIAQDILQILLLQPKYLASVDTLQGMLSEPGPIKHAEKELLNRGLVAITGRGRQLTDEGVARANLLMMEG
jgi:Holliday junction DNA helicase RuvB